VKSGGVETRTSDELLPMEETRREREACDRTMFTCSRNNYYKFAAMRGGLLLALL
jgi:hypothetical protein